MKSIADHQATKRHVEETYPAGYVGTISEDTSRHLYKAFLQAAKNLSDNSGLQELLTSGCKLFELEYALLLRRLSHQVAEVHCAVEVDDSSERYFIGQHIMIDKSPAATIFDTKKPCSYQIKGKIGEHGDGFAYNGVDINAYLGALVSPASTEPLVMCLFSGGRRNADFTAQDIETIELLAEGVACMVDLQKSQTQRKMTDQAMLALGSVKTLDEYLQQARLPEVYGVPARVVEVLQRRVGHAPMSIGHIADELNLSKRTLQRRLQQQDISFADLRDQVRFHHSIDYLIKQHQSIDSISASLDFSDRTSFTNAFKRWTGLSPSAFRKLFRDYV